MKSGKAVYRNHLSLSRRFSYFKYEIHDEGETCVKVGKRFFYSDYKVIVQQNIQMKPNQNLLAPQQNRQFLKMCF